ncbi:MAG: hypothetical protein GEU26_14475 [Nitrososphaeraceae archaeon]|nr:hypothetical protein [Nitrososphaeraceae archaeon]
MPAISLRCSTIAKDEAALRSLNSLIHNERYNSEILLSNNLYFVGCTKYKEYPVQTFESDKLWICLEGRIYGKERSILNQKPHSILMRVFDNGIADEITNWLLETDGEFVIYALNKTNQDFIVLNDALGRLPTYYYIMK